MTQTDYAPCISQWLIDLCEKFPSVAQHSQTKRKGYLILPPRTKDDPRSNPELKPQKERLYYGWVVLVLLFVISVIILGIHFSFGVFFKSFQEDFGWSRASTSGVYSAYLLLSAIFAIITGWALDRYGSRVVFSVMGIFTALGLLLTSQVSLPWQLFVTYSLLLAIGTGGIYVASMATVNRWFIKRRGLVLGIVGSGANIGVMVMGSFAVYLISRYDWQTASLTIGLTALFILIPCSFLLRRFPSEIAAPSQVQGPQPVNHGFFERQHCSAPKGLSLPDAVKTRNFWFLSLMLFLFASCVYLVMTHLVPHAIDLGIPPIQTASLLSMIGGSGVLGKMLIGRLSDTIGRKQAYIICPMLMAGAMLWLVWSSDLWMFYLFAIVFGFAFGGLSSANAALFGDAFGLRHLGAIMGVAEVGWQTGAAVGSLLGGYMFDASGSYVFAFIAGVIVSLAVAMLGLFLRTPKPPIPQ